MKKKNGKHSTRKHSSRSTSKISSKKKSAISTKSKKSSFFYKPHSRKPSSPSCWHEIDDDELEQELEESQKDGKKLEKPRKRK